MDWTRPGATGLLAALGVGFAVPNARFLLDTGAGTGLEPFVLAVLGLVVSLALVAAAGWLYRSPSFSTSATVRVTAWTTAGVVLIGVILLVARGTRAVQAPAYFESVLLAVTAFAHVVIGVTDARRIRAQALADERQKSAVFTRVLRHNLRTGSQLLAGVADRLETDGPVRERAEALAALSDAATEIDRTIDRDPDESETVDVVELVAATAADARRVHGATVETDVPRECRARAGSQLRVAVRELVDNAVEHGAEPVHVAVDCSADVAITVADAGDGIPPAERDLLAGEGPETPLDHSSGLGLWTAKWITASYGGDLRFTDDGAVVLRVPGAR